MEGLNWIAITVVLALLSWKTLPLVWHIRLIRVLVEPLLLRPRLYDASKDGKLIFAPRIISSRSPISEIDWNMHKSNSTFFTDLDIVRIDALAHLFSGALRVIAKAEKRKAVPMLGGATCTFRREIAPYARYEMWTSILAWDEKWLYVVTRFVRPRNGSSRNQGKSDVQDVYATATARYVFKSGRQTITPEHMLEAAGLLPSTHSKSECGITGWSLEDVEARCKCNLREAKAAFEALDGIHSDFNRD